MMIWQLERPEIRRGGQRALADYVRLRVLCPGQTLSWFPPHMPRKPLPGPSRLSQILKHLQQEPIPTLPALSSLRLTYALRNDHFGAR